MTYDKELILRIFSEEQTKTNAAKKYCEVSGIDYNESIRKNITKIINKATEDGVLELSPEPEAVSVLSALKTDGTIMNIEEYCEFYKIPFEQVKSYKICTHSTRGAYYNIASHTMTGAGVDTFKVFAAGLLEDLKNISSKTKTIARARPVEAESYLLVVDPADCHVGKLAESFETGEDYNNQIAIKRIREGVEGIIEKTKGFPIEKILFVGGNDILHIDTPKRTTTSGTPQDTDGMWYTNFLMAKEIYVEILNRLLEIADVHFVFNPSNHDYQTGFFLADVIQTYFKDCKNITFDCSIAHRKYFTYGENLIGTSHGDGGKVADLPLTMAHESKDWSSCKHKYFYIHHFHHKMSKDYMGVCVEALRSPSGTDSWHSRNQYHFAPKAIEGFLHSKTHGQIARIVHLF